MVESISSINPMTHDLRRRLAMAFCFNDPSLSKTHSHQIMDLDKFHERLNNKAFDAKPDTDYRELAALVSLLDIAVDDGRSISLNLSDRQVEKDFDDDVEIFAKAIDSIIKSIGTPRPGYTSKIEARAHLTVVSQRIGDTVRSRPKPKKSFIDANIKMEAELQNQRESMSSFLKRV